MLYFLRKIKMDQLIKGFEDFEVYVDSPLAIEATSIFNKCMTTYPIKFTDFCFYINFLTK